MEVGMPRALMGNDVAPRKEFIIESSATLERERIDA
jgi:hypothetical protein